MSVHSPNRGSRMQLQVATSIWFGSLIVCLLATDAIARMDTRVIAAIIVVVATVMFTCMQVIAREMASSRSIGRPEVGGFMKRSVADLALRNLIAVASIYAILWSLGALPF